MASWIKTDGTIIPVEPKNGEDFQLEELKKYIGGGYIEIVLIDHDHYLVVDDEGIRKELPYNETATAVYQFGRITGNVILGDALLCLRREIL